MPMPPPRSGVTLTTICEVQPEAIVIGYRLVNADPYVAIYAFDGAAGDPDDPTPDLSSQLYVTFEPPEIVGVKRVWPPLPKGANIRCAVVPAMSHVSPSGTRSVRFRLPLPLRERSEYFPHYPGAEYRPARARRLALTIGYLREVEGFRAECVNQELGIFRMRGTREPQHFVTATVTADLQVLVRVEDYFQRV